MGSLKITLVCLLVRLPTIAGLSCLQCEDFFIDTDNQALKNAVKNTEGYIETPACRAPVDNKTTTLPLEQCSNATGGLVNTCSFLIVSASGSGGGQSVEFTYTKRGCNVVQDSQKDSCQEYSASNLLGASSTDGSICYCSTDKCNGKTRLIPAVTVFFLSLLAFCFLKG